MLAERVKYHKVVSLLEFDDGVPFLIGWELLQALLNEATIQPVVKGLLLEVEFYADNSRGCGSERMCKLILLSLIRYSNLYIIYN